MRYKYGQTTLYLEDDTAFDAKFCYFPGQRESSNWNTGVFQEGLEPWVEITDVRFVDKWESVEDYPQLNPDTFHDDLMDAVQLMYEMEQPE